jgi:hypothetical protein
MLAGQVQRWPRILNCEWRGLDWRKSLGGKALPPNLRRAGAQLDFLMQKSLILRSRISRLHWKTS